MVVPSVPPVTSGPYLKLLSLQSAGIKLGLERIRAVLRQLEHPEKHAKRTLIIAGTNGKGSAASTLSAAIASSGVRCGLFTSPHLVRPTERFRIQDRPISWDQFDAAAERVLAVIKNTGTQLSFFEAMTVMGFLLFQAEDVELQVLEVGLGGRRDATRVAEPTHTLVMGVARDHTRILGSTLAEIAKEKLGACGVASSNVFGLPPRLQSMCPEGWHLGKDIRWRRSPSGALVVNTPERRVILEHPKLLGGHQRRNLALAAAMGVRLGLKDEHLQAGASNVWWPARMQKLAEGPDTWLDGAHNPAAIDRLLQTLPEAGVKPGYTLVFGAHPKKDARPMLRRLAEQAGAVWVTSADKLVPAETLLPYLDGRPHVYLEPDAGRAVEKARALGEQVLVAGSLYLAGAVLGWAETTVLPSDDAQ